MIDVGIVGVGTYLPEKTMKAAEIARLTNGVWSEDAVMWFSRWNSDRSWISCGLLFNRYCRKKYRPECISGIPYESVK